MSGNMDARSPFEGLSGTVKHRERGLRKKILTDCLHLASITHHEGHVERTL